VSCQEFPEDAASLVVLLHHFQHVDHAQIRNLLNAGRLVKEKGYFGQDAPANYYLHELPHLLLVLYPHAHHSLLTQLVQIHHLLLSLLLLSFLEDIELHLALNGR